MDASAASTAIPTDEPEGERATATEAGQTRMFEFTGFVHVGPDAAKCEDAVTGTCSNPLHFHGWCRIPNQFQHKSIREKALAAKARRVRQFRSEETDSYAILETALDDVRRNPELGIAELVRDKLFDTRVQAIRDLQEDERWKTIGEDEERLRVLANMPEEERPQDEYVELKAHIDTFAAELATIVEERQSPLRESLAALDIEALVEEVRKLRINAEAQAAFNHTYAMWEGYVCTLKPNGHTLDPEHKVGFPTERVFASIEEFQGAAPEVVDGIDAMFTMLEASFGRRGVAEGN